MSTNQACGATRRADQPAPGRGRPAGAHLLRIGLGLLLALVLLAAVLVANTLRHTSRQVTVAPIAAPRIDLDGAVQRLSGALRVRTVSQDGRPPDAAVLREFRAYLESRFPLVHQRLRREVVNESSLLFTWEGTKPQGRPMLLMAHQDLAPIAPGSEPQWTHDPFSGAVADGFVWGRGAMDDKASLVAILEAVEFLIGAGFEPDRTIYLAFGHDEETGPTFGQEGARRIADLLKQRGVRLEFVLDEGLLISSDIIKGLSAPVAVIGVAEKGFMTVRVSALGTPGHSSMPPARTAIGDLAGGLNRIMQARAPATLHPVVRDMMETLAPEFNFSSRLALSNLWLFEPIVRRQLDANPGTAAMLRSTVAPTILSAGEKVSVLPARADAYINFRLLPGETREQVLERTRNAVDDRSLLVEYSGLAWEGSRVSSTDGAAYGQVQRTIREVFPQVLVAPGLIVGGTDSHHFKDVAENIYGFSPVRVRPEDLPRFHGTNERISIENYAEMIRFYCRLLSAPSARSPQRLADQAIAG